MSTLNAEDNIFLHQHAYPIHIGADNAFALLSWEDLINWAEYYDKTNKMWCVIYIRTTDSL